MDQFSSVFIIRKFLGTIKNSKATVRIFVDPHRGFYIVTSILVSGNPNLDTFITLAVIVSYCPFIMFTQHVAQVGYNPGSEACLVNSGLNADKYTSLISDRPVQSW
jgi:hypothetical protein